MPEAWAMDAAFEGLSEAEIDREAQAFALHHWALAGSKALKEDWHSVWVLWCKRGLEHRAAAAPAPAPSTPGPATVDVPGDPILADLYRRVGATAFRAWFAGVRARQEGAGVVLLMPSAFARQEAETRFRDKLDPAWKLVFEAKGAKP
ncbi:DnaA N-terminal domain-containing protein [Elstera sp.]|uniref:DnaA N-terminal domain-containing protein n=1 Tax=Elstera sp. TaxID=1916664 RepID=UPI0037BFCA5D